MSSPCQLPMLSDEQYDWAVDARACGMEFNEIASKFIDMFPDYGAPSNISSEDLVLRLETRIKDRLKDSSVASAKYYLEAKQRGELPINIEALPLVQPHIQILYMQRLLDDPTLKPDIIRAKLAVILAAENKCKEIGMERPEKYNNFKSPRRKELLVNTDNDTKGETDVDP